MIEIRESEIHYPKDLFALADHKIVPLSPSVRRPFDHVPTAPWSFDSSFSGVH